MLSEVKTFESLDPRSYRKDYFPCWSFPAAVVNKVKESSSAKDPDPLDPQDFGLLDPDPQKYADPRIRIQVAKYVCPFVCCHHCT